MQPFDRYRNGGTEPLGKPKQGDASSRHGYGLPVIEQCGALCVYCGRNLLQSYENWLDLSVDHVVPRSDSWYPACQAWVEDLANLVTCCRACNEFLNQFRCSSQQPASFAEFAVIRDAVFLSKRRQAMERHEQERAWFANWRNRIGVDVC